jgi:hypothetical protein
MSAYTLPGVLFPPLPSSFDIYNINNNNINDSDDNRDRYGDTSTSTTTTLQTHLQQHNEAPIRISIVDAKIDAIQLIQSLVSYTTNNNINNTHNSIATNYKKQNQKRTLIHTTKTTPSSSSYCYDECMVFTLQIQNNHNIHNDVIDNHDRRNNNDLVQQNTTSSTSSTTSSYTITRTAQQILQFYHELQQQQQQQQYDDDTGSLQIANLPLLLLNYDSRNQHPSTSSSNNHKSFAYLHDQIRYYTPIIEQWFQDIIAITCNTRHNVVSSLQQFITSEPNTNQNTNIDTTPTTNTEITNMTIVNHDSEEKNNFYNTNNDNNHQITSVFRRKQSSSSQQLQYSSASYSYYYYSNHYRNKNKPTTRRIVSMESIEEEK